MGFVPSINVAFLMLFVCMIFWGSWVNTFKKCGDWRFEGFYIDYAWSIVLWTFLLSVMFGGFRFGGWSSEGVLWAMFAGFVWGIGNILILPAIELAGIAIAFPLFSSIVIVLGTFLAYITNPAATKNPQFLFTGIIIITIATIVNGIAYKIKEKANAQKKSLKRGIIISLICGIFIALFPFPFNYAFKAGLNGYEGTFFMALGGLISTAIMLPLLMKKPLVPKHTPIKFSEYNRAKLSWHLWAIFGGLLWSIATVFNLVVGSLPNFSVAIAFTIGQGAPMIAAIWGIFVWKEFKGSPKKAILYLWIMFILFILGIVIIANAAG